MFGYFNFVIEKEEPGRLALPILFLLISSLGNSFGFAQRKSTDIRKAKREITAKLSEVKLSVTDDFIRTVTAELQETKTPGAAMVIVNENRVVFFRGFGTANVETSAPVTGETLFHIGSLTKMITAAVIVNLAN